MFSSLCSVGIVSSLLGTPIMSKLKAYNAFQKLLVGYCLVTMAAVLAVNRPVMPGAVIACWLLFGAGVQPLIPLSFEHAAEITYPVPADSSASMLMTGANIMGFVLTFAITPLLTYEESATCRWVTAHVRGGRVQPDGRTSGWTCTPTSLRSVITLHVGDVL